MTDTSGVAISVRPYRAPPPDPYADLPDYTPPKSGATSADPYADLPDYEPKPPPRQVGMGEATVSGLTDMFGFGLAPVLQGLSEVSKTVHPDLNDPIVGAGKLIASHFSEHPDPEVAKAYERGRKKAVEDKKLAEEQHPLAFLAGQIGGAVLGPSMGALKTGSAAARALSAGRAGATQGGLYGSGEAIGEGKDIPEIASRGASGAAIGGATGGIIGAALGPRLVAAATPGQQAATTAERLGAPLPKGVVSDNPAIQATTAKMRQIPFAGEKIGERVGETQAAAGEHIGDIASGMAASPDRAAADAILKPGLEKVIADNRATIDAGYNGARSLIDQNRRFTMPRTDAALNEIMAARKAAGWTNPAQGLEQFRNVAGGATFNGAHRARVDARDAGNVLVPHPGYNADDFNRLTRAMTADLRDMAHTAGGPRALAAFDAAEKEFGKLAEQNGILQKLANSKGEGTIATLLGAAKEKGGDVRLLAQLKAKMDPADFQQIGGMLLHELGQHNPQGDFSLAKFVTNWNKVSDGAKRVLFSPTHLRDIEDIVGMGQHIKGALKESSTSHSASFLVLLDVAKDAALLGADIASGGLGLGSAIGAGTTAGMFLLTKWLASPAKAASMSAWSRAYQGMRGPTPARAAVFKIATRNLANNLGIPMQKLLTHVHAQEEPNANAKQ